MDRVLLAVFSYLAGSFPSAYLLARVLRKVDVRRVGSGNVGATNVFKNIGPLAGAITGLIDAGKGALVVLVARHPPFDPAVDPLWAVVAAMIGHNWPVWLRFQGGGGLATFVGGLAMLVPFWQVVVLGLTWWAFYLIPRHKYVSSVLMCALLPAWLGWARSSWDFFAFGLAAGMTLGVKQVRAWIRWARGRPHTTPSPRPLR